MSIYIICKRCSVLGLFLHTMIGSCGWASQIEDATCTEHFEVCGVVLLQTDAIAKSALSLEDRAELAGPPHNFTSIATGTNGSRVRNGTRVSRAIKVEGPAQNRSESSSTIGNATRVVEDEVGIHMHREVLEIERAWDNVFRPKNHHVFPRLIKRVWEQQQEHGGEDSDDIVKAATRVDELGEVQFGSGMSTVSWALLFLVNLAALSFFVKLYVDRKQVEIEVDEKFEDERGAPCWTYICGVLLFCLCYAAFAATVLSIASENKDIRQDPTSAEGANVVRKYPITNVGARAFQTGEGVALSIATAICIVFGLRSDDKVQITTSLLAQYMLRGSSWCLLITIILEDAGMGLLSAMGLNYSLTNMLVVGFVEEGSKALCVVCGTYLIADAMSDAQTSPGCLVMGCCVPCFPCVSKRCRTLVTSQRGLMLAGMAVGFGFMTCENAGYVLETATTPPERDFDANGNVVESTGKVAINVMTIMLIAVRVIFNIHPWLAGLSAGRIARLAFKEKQPASPVAWLSCRELLWAVYPSALCHAAFDFLVSAGSSLLSIACLFGFYWWSSRSFRLEWEDDKDDDLPKADIKPEETPDVAAS